MSRFSEFGNHLYTGERSFDFVGRYKRWYAVSAVLFLIAALGVGVRGINWGIEFTGGSDFRVSQVSNFDDYEAKARDAVTQASGTTEAVTVTRVGTDGVRVQTEQFNDQRTSSTGSALAKAFGVTANDVSSSVIGPSWGASVSQKAIQALLWFLLLVSVVLAIYFRTWKMALAALVALLHDIFITVGVYALAGLEVTPASMIGFLTILGYSLYDTVVVFDKVRENTDYAVKSGRQSFAYAANLAVNQTLVRSINTTVVALLPVGALLLVGIFVLGPGTLLDLSVALFIGIAVGAYSSIFIATPMYAHLREMEPEIKDLTHRIERQGQRRTAAAGARAGGAEPAVAGVGALPRANLARSQFVDDEALADQASSAYDPEGDQTLTGRPKHPYLQEQQRGPRNQPRRLPKSKR